MVKVDGFGAQHVFWALSIQVVRFPVFQVCYFIIHS